jgi:hypothetical protein
MEESKDNRDNREVADLIEVVVPIFASSNVFSDQTVFEIKIG